LAALLFLPGAATAATPAEVACEEAKLDRLIQRFSPLAAGDNLFLWPTGGDHFSGLAVSRPIHGDPVTGVLSRAETQLAFDLTLEPAGGFLNPKRQLLPQAILVRRDPESNLSATVPVNGVSFELAPHVIDPTLPQQGLLIAGRLGADYGSASGASRGLAAAELFERCPAEEPSEFDLQAFEILARTVRITEDLLLPFPGQGLFLFKAIIFRDVEPLTYRIRVFEYLSHCELECGDQEAGFQLRVRLPTGPDGKLAAGRIDVLPWCDTAPAPCTNLINPDTAVLVAPPIFAGHEVQTAAQYRRGAFLNIPFEDSPDNILSDDVPWPDLLRGTAWDRPLGLP